MRKNLFVLSMLFLISLLAKVDSFSQITSSRPNFVKEVPCFSDKTIDATLKNLPANYHGNDLRGLIYEMIRREKLTKDEFETTKQFMERVENEKKKNFLGELNSDSLFSFEIYGADFRYDADNESMNFEILFPSLISWISPCQNEERYVGPRNNYKLLVESMGKNSFPLKLNFKIDVERAKKAK